MARDYFAGVMSGTSLDGVDAVIADFEPSGGKPCRTLGAAHVQLPTMLRDELLALQLPGKNELARAPGLASSARSIAARIASLLVASPLVSNTTTLGGRSPVPNRSSDLWFAS